MNLYIMILNTDIILIRIDSFMCIVYIILKYVYEYLYHETPFLKNLIKIL